jgi:WD40 repeat protein/serine/threonine protein kinase
MVTESTDRDALLASLANEFAARYRQGERPSLEDYCERYPELAADIRDLFPALVEIEQVKEDCRQAQEPSAPGVLQQLGDFRILREIGKGGMGVVYEAEQISLGRHVAVKVLAKQMLLDARARSRFEREARAAARLHHTNIVPVFGVGEHEGLPYYVMQFIHGSGLDQVLEELKRLHENEGGLGESPPDERQAVAGAASVALSLWTGVFAAPTDALPRGGDGTDRLSGLPGLSSPSVTLPGQNDASGQPGRKKPTYWQSVAQIGVQVAGALEYAHRQGILHRDVKPSNLLLDATGTVWVTDFGLARVDDQQNLTHTGDILGTLRYLPPEALEGRSDACGDVYALGLTLYELLALRPAFDEKDRPRLINQVARAEPPRLRKVNQHVPRDLETIVHKAIDGDPVRRYQTAEDLRADLQRFLDDEPIKARRLSGWERRRRWARRNRGVAAALSAVVLLLVVIATGSVVAAVYFQWQGQKQRDLADDNKNLAEAERQATGELRRNLYFAEMNLAGQAADSLSGLGQVRLLLANWQHRRPDLRGWEWYYLQGLCHRDRLTCLGANSINGVAWSPDGHRLALANTQGTVEVRDAATGRILRVLHGHTGSVAAVAWAPGGRWLASAGWDRTIRVWDADSGKELGVLRGHRREVRSVAWSPDGRRLASAGDDQTIKVWDMAGPRPAAEPRTLRGHTRTVAAVAWARDSRRLASASWDHSARVWDATTGVQLVQFNHVSLVDSVAWSPDGRLLASGCWDQAIHIWGTHTWTEVQTLRGHLSRVFALAWAPDSRRLVSGSGDSTVKVWDTNGAGRALATLRGHTYEVLSVAWSPDGTRLASASMDRTVKVWEPAGYLETFTLAGDGSPVRAAPWSPDGRRLALSGGDQVKVWDAGESRPAGQAGGKAPRVLGKHLQLVWSLAWSPDGRRLASGSQDVKVWDMATGAVLFTVHGTDKTVRAVAWSPDGRRLAAGNEDGAVRIYDAAGKEVFTFRDHGSSGVCALAWSPDGARLASGSWDHVVRVWDAATGAEIFTLRGHENQVTAVAWSPDGKRLATASGDRTVKIWDAASGKETLTLRGHTNWVFSVAWSPDGLRLASGCEDGTIKVWDTASGKETLNLRGHSGQVRSVSWNRDGRRLASGSTDGTVKVWDATPGFAVERSARLLPLLNARLAANPRSLRDLRLRAEVLAGLGEWDRAAVDVRDYLSRRSENSEPWFQTGWWVVGPYPDDLEDAYPPEAEADPFKPPAGVAWRAADPEARVFLNLGAMFDHAEHISAYALTRVFCREKRKVTILLGSDDGVRLWLNGELVHDNPAFRSAVADQDAVVVTLAAGWNTLLAKVVNGIGDHALYLRLSDDPADRARALARRRTTDRGEGK